MKALIVDDDLALADVVSFTMRRAGYEVVCAHDGLAALEAWESERPDLVILDLNLPKLDGLSVCRRMRAKTDTPIIILSVRGEEDDVVQGLNFGADDYIVKPFSPRQLVARSEAVLRRASAPAGSQGPLKLGSLTLDPARSLLEVEAQEVHLTNLECDLLEALMINHGQVMTHASLIDAVWGPAGADKIMLKQLIYRLRKKLEPDSSKPEYLQTVAGIGYTLTA
ncbi:MAG: response regulator transcription factor [Anaerolineales bacterium]|nr:response regulator transcription factor [Anaerolineales bacterium]